MSQKMQAKEARIMIWEELRKVAKPDSRFAYNFAEFITDYEGSDDGARLFVQQDFYKNAKVIFVTPDNNMELLRELIIRDKKTLVMTNYSISRGFFVVEPGMVPEGKEELAGTLDGVARFWKHQTLAQLKETVGHIDLLVTGASAITMGGVRFGKGHGYLRLVAPGAQAVPDRTVEVGGQAAALMQEHCHLALRYCRKARRGLHRHFGPCRRFEAGLRA
jgi:5-formyltetrahydrofolate cyclo-ligase